MEAVSVGPNGGIFRDHSRDGAPPDGWESNAVPGTCHYCGKARAVRPEPFGHELACRDDWEAIVYGGPGE